MIQEKYRCVVDGEDCDFFVPGKVYDVNDDGSVKSEDGDTYRPRDGRPVVQWLAEDYGYQFEKLPMREQLMNGDVVECRNGYQYVCLHHGGADRMCCYNNSGYNDLVTNDPITLKEKEHGEKWDIVKVYRPLCSRINPWKSMGEIDVGEMKLIWSTPKQMTLKEVIAELGYEIEIVEEKE